MICTANVWLVTVGRNSSARGVGMAMKSSGDVAVSGSAWYEMPSRNCGAPTRVTVTVKKPPRTFSGTEGAVEVKPSPTSCPSSLIVMVSVLLASRGPPTPCVSVTKNVSSGTSTTSSSLIVTGMVNCEMPLANVSEPAVWT